MTFAAGYALVVGMGMIGQWALSYRAGQIPELQTEPIRIGFHLAGEMLTAVALIAAALGLLTGQTWAMVLYLVAFGMLLYTAVVSPGYFAQRGQWIWVGIFTAVIALGLLSVALLLR